MDNASDKKIELNKSRFDNRKSILNFINSRITGVPKNITIICAGHFMLLKDKDLDILIPGIFPSEGDDESKSIERKITGVFPQYTWDLGCEILSKLKRKNLNGQLSLLVNDWQLVPPDLKRKKGQPNRYRKHFYDNFDRLPDQYEKHLKKYSLNFNQDIFKLPNGDFFLREVNLKDKFTRSMKKLRNNQNDRIWDMCHLYLDEKGDITVHRGDASLFPLMQNSRVGCTGGVAQMMVDTTNHLKSKYNNIRFINFMPRSCTDPVNVASEYTLNLFQNELGLHIINIFFEAGDVAHMASDKTSNIRAYAYENNGFSNINT